MLEILNPALKIQQELLDPNSSLNKELAVLMLQGAEKRKAFACHLYQHYLENQRAEITRTEKKELRKEKAEAKAEAWDNSQELAKKLAVKLNAKGLLVDKIDNKELEKQLVKFQELAAEVVTHTQTVKEQQTILNEITQKWDKRQEVLATSLASQCVDTLKSNLNDDTLKFDLTPPKDAALKAELAEAYKVTSPATILAVNPQLEIEPEVMACVGDCVGHLDALFALHKHLDKDDGEKHEFPLPSLMRKLNAVAPTPMHAKKDTDEIGLAIDAHKKHKGAIEALTESQEKLGALCKSLEATIDNLPVKSEPTISLKK
jgi:hypothetical protein